MAGLTNQIATALAAKLAAVSGMVGAAATGVDTIPDTPYAILGPARSTDLQPGAWETEGIEFPLLVMVGRVISASDSLASAYDLKDSVQTALRSNIELGMGASGVTMAVLSEWNTDNYYEVGGEAYQALEGVIRVRVARPMGGSWTA